jgi:hypothetical protein
MESAKLSLILAKQLALEWVLLSSSGVCEMNSALDQARRSS